MVRPVCLLHKRENNCPLILNEYNETSIPNPSSQALLYFYLSHSHNILTLFSLNHKLFLYSCLFFSHSTLAHMHPFKYMTRQNSSSSKKLLKYLEGSGANKHHKCSSGLGTCTAGKPWAAQCLTMGTIPFPKKPLHKHIWKSNKSFSFTFQCINTWAKPQHLPCSYITLGYYLEHNCTGTRNMNRSITHTWQPANTSLYSTGICFHSYMFHSFLPIHPIH